jgi:hypothetical protein
LGVSRKTGEYRDDEKGGGDAIGSAIPIEEQAVEA